MPPECGPRAPDDGIQPPMNAMDDQPHERRTHALRMSQPQLQDLLEAGVHFGHQTRRWNPKMRRFIFAERSGIYIIDLQKTLRQIAKAQELLRDGRPEGRQRALRLHQEAAQGRRAGRGAPTRGALYVTERWLGGMLTNFQTIKKQIRRLRDLEQGAADGDFENYTKKEKLLFERERVKLSRNLEGIKNMSRLPGRAVRRRRQEGEDRGGRGQQARDPGGGHRGHQRRSRRDHGADPGQRRRDPRRSP